MKKKNVECLICQKKTESFFCVSCVGKNLSSEELNSLIINSQKMLDSNKKEKIKEEIISKFSNKENIKLLSTTLESLSFDDLQIYETSVLKESEDIDSLKRNIKKNKIIESSNLPNPKEILKELNKHIIGQERLTQDMTIAITQYLCRINDTQIPKNNILIAGPTGSGKTEISRVIAKKFNLPMLEVDATTLTAEGYVGASLSESIVNGLMAKCDNDKKLAERSIVFIDEIDKKAASKSSSESGMNSTAIQNELLKILEGTVLKSKSVSLDTSNILFICAGAFSDITNKRIKKEGIGLNKNKNIIIEEETDLTPNDLVDFGLSRELIGRFGTITQTRHLPREALKEILLNKPDSIFHQFQKLFSQYKIKMTLSDNLIEHIIDKSVAQNTGARGLNQILSGIIKPIILDAYQFIGSKIEVDIDVETNTVKILPC